jgi:hypothetical protein
VISAADNIIFCPPPPAQPSRAVVIDFGQSNESILHEHQSDAEWESVVDTVGNEVTIKVLLRKAGIRDLDPRRPQIRLS